jgi:ATP-dependent protease ClpP protease subunit
MKPHSLSSLSPTIRLFGSVNENMLSEFFRQQAQADAQQPVIFELSTSGGEADVGRRMALELRLWQDQGAKVYFLGKSYVFSAGITIMSAIPVERRFLARDCELLIHERKITRDLSLDGSLRSCKAKVNDMLAEIESGQRLEREGFAQLVQGCRLSVEELERRVLEKDWFLNAREAADIGLVAGVL